MSRKPPVNEPDILPGNGAGAKLFPVVGIGASAGGVEAISALLEHLPPDLGMAYVVVQHLAAGHPSILPEILERKTGMTVCPVTDKIQVKPDHVYVIPPDTYMTISDGALRLTPRSKLKSGLHTIDYFLTTLARTYRNHSVAVILSGTASDGTLGVQAVKEEGGITMAQDASAAFRGMPQHAIDAGLIDLVLPPAGIAAELTAIARLPYTIAAPDEPVPWIDAELRRIHAILKDLHGVDFSFYKSTTINRRILRRMALHRLERLEQYTRLLQESNVEVSLLYKDLLINVTSFFRDPELFDALQKKIFPALFASRKAGDPIRFWIPACSTGEEACSFAISLFEYLGDQALNTPVQIFATDLSEHAIDRARTGIYPKSALEHVSPERVSRFFIRIDGHYQIVKPVRDICVFATHNLLKDPPFSRMDLISCQNALIYLEPNAQKKILQSFHYALKPTGFLLLGKSETIGNSTDLFQQADKQLKQYTRVSAPTAISFELSTRPGTITAAIIGETRQDQDRIGTEVEVEQETDRLLLSHYVPASVVVNKDLQIVRFQGAAFDFLRPAPGKASLHLLKMVRDELLFDLRALLVRARRGKQPVKKEGIPYVKDGRTIEISLDVLPVNQRSGNEPYFLIVFREDAGSAVPAGQLPAPEKGPRQDARGKQIQKLEREQKEALEQMKIMTEEFEATREELQSANEEVLSSNEELQSINEELETSKEELQSSNEELTTINDELQIRNNDLKDSVTFREAILDSMREPLVVLNYDMRVQMANKAFFSTFKMIADDVDGNHFFEIGNRFFHIPDLKKELEEIVYNNQKFREFELRHSFPGMGEKILLLHAIRMRQEEVKKDRFLLTIDDITLRKKAEEGLMESLTLNSTILNSINDVFLTVDNSWNCTYLNRPAEQFIQQKASDARGRKLWDLLHSYIGTELHTRTLESMRTKTFTEFEFFAEPVQEWQHYRIYPSPGGLSIFSNNITERKHAEQRIRDSEQRYQTFILQSTEGIWRFELEEPVDITLPPAEQIRMFYAHSYLAECNNAMARMYGFSKASEVIGMRIADMIPSGAESEAYFTAFILAGYVMTDGESHELDKHGREKYFLNNMVGIIEDGKMIRAWGTQRDITEQKRAELELRRTQQHLQLALSAGSVGTWIRDLKTDQLIWTPEQEALYGIPAGTFDGRIKTWEEIVLPEDLEQMKRVLEVALPAHKEISNEFRIVLPDGSVRWIMAKANVIKDADGTPLQLAGVSINITGRKMLEQQKDEFIGIASHELKTPVTSIKAYTELLLDTFEDDGNTEAAGLIRKLDGQVDRLTDLIKNLLDVTRISDGQLPFRNEQFDMNELIRETAEEMQRTTQKHRLIMKLSPAPLVWGDREKTAQVLINLLSNAIKYSPAADRVIITSQVKDEMITVSVEDFGIGIEEDIQEKVFDRFFRAGGPAINTFPGLGLGLYISAEIIKKQGGSIHLTSKKGKGSVFTFSLPVSDAE